MVVWPCDLAFRALPYNKPDGLQRRPPRDPSTASMRPLAGKCALITGSVRGLGLAAAHRFAAAGCDIVLNGFGAEKDIADLRREIEDQHGVRTRYEAADLQHHDEIERMISSAIGEFGSIDILVNNAVVRHTAPVEAFATSEWDKGMAVNLSASFHTIRLTVPGMKQRGWGRIINVSSIYGLRGAVNRVGYVTSKTALIGLTRAVALETVTHGITCNAVCPGTTETPVHEATIRTSMAQGLSREESEKRLLAGKQPTGQLISANDVAALMVFLCGPESASITGAVLPIDGAWSSA
jgi:3-hydroxybutyrate dehydrogenase